MSNRRLRKLSQSDQNKIIDSIDRSIVLDQHNNSKDSNLVESNINTATWLYDIKRIGIIVLFILILIVALYIVDNKTSHLLDLGKQILHLLNIG